MRGLAVLAVVVGVLSCGVGSSAAQGGQCRDVFTPTGIVVVCHDHGGVGGGSGGSSHSDDPYVVMLSTATVDGITCVQTSYSRLSAAYGGGRTEDEVTALTATIAVSYLSFGYPACPGTATITPDSFARDYLRSVQLPVPSPQIDPGRMLVGLEAFLETGSPITYELTEASTPFGPATFAFTSTITVDWDDGSPLTGPVATSGGPYPNGDLRHVYTRKGDYDIVVTQDWTATWNVGGEGGTVAGLQTSGTLAGFPVQEREAVLVGS
jgi:hypothetical protein